MFRLIWNEQRDRFYPEAMSTLTVIVGNPKPASRTLHIAEALGRRVAERVGAELQPTIDLAEQADQIFLQKSETLDHLTARLAATDYAIIASPTYKASYTGLLKAFLDRYPSNGLAGITAIPVFTIGGSEHALAVEYTLRPLLVELGASTPTRGLAFPVQRYEELDEILDNWIAEQDAALGRPIGTGRSRS